MAYHIQFTFSGLRYFCCFLLLFWRSFDGSRYLYIFIFAMNLMKRIHSLIHFNCFVVFVGVTGVIVLMLVKHVNKRYLNNLKIFRYFYKILSFLRLAQRKLTVDKIAISILESKIRNIFCGFDGNCKIILPLLYVKDILITFYLLVYIRIGVEYIVLPKSYNNRYKYSLLIQNVFHSKNPKIS